jgi:hypothetical protein
MHNKKITNIIDWMDMYFISHFGRYPFFGFQTHTHQRICIKVRNTS